jgi:hypothetical protein
VLTPLTAASAVFGKEQGDLLPGFVGDLSAPDHTHSSSSRALYEQKLSWIFVFIRDPSPTNTTLLGKCPSGEIVSEESIPLLLVKKAGLLDIVFTICRTPALHCS